MAMSKSSSSLPDDAARVRLVPFGLPDLSVPHASPDVLAELHAELLPTSPLVKLGPHFLRDFYYRVLPEEGLVLGYVAYVDDRPVGFLATTRDANGFLSAAMRRRWRSVLAVLLRHPPSLRRHRAERVSEFLSLGVRPTRQHGVTTGPSRRQVARTLMDAASEHLPRPLVALVDETNAPARRMYDELGWTVSDRLTAGWPVTQLVYRWEGSGSGV
jgi:ribosomal protein S18 acetylase RimI-like enzyme